jgi:hypothetical protein
MLSHPDEDRVASEDGLSENHAYVDVRGVTSDEAREAAEEELILLQRISTVDGKIQDIIVEEIEDSLREEIHPLAGFDLGVGGLVLALSSIGCIPISSCNGGVVGGSHSLPHPWIIFYAPLATIDRLLEAAMVTNVGLINSDNGMLELYSDSVLNFNLMAKYLAS